MANLKEHGLNISISTLGAMIPILAFMWIFVKPTLMESISTALADEFDDQIEEQTLPMQRAFKVLLRTDITELRKEVARMKTHEDDEDWDEGDAEDLAELEIEYEALRDAYNEL